MTEILFLIEDDPEGGYTAQSLYNDLAIFTEADTMTDLKNKIMDALGCHFESEEEIPKLVRLHYVRDEVINYAPAS